KPLSVRLITLDNYRIGARKQIETYGEIMGIPVACVETFAELEKKLALYDGADLVLIDTIGKSPKDYMKLAEMRELLDACGNTAETHLAISATTKTSDLYEILQQFEPFKYRSVILTKLDETTHIGNIVSVLSEKQKSISFFTDGQVVPQDIQKANIVRLLINLEGFRINKDRLTKKFTAAKVFSDSR
ncbi:MAG: flagellar biosynthesis protein FlhF, partial [Spirochaetota bacterium]